MMVAVHVRQGQAGFMKSTEFRFLPFGLFRIRVTNRFLSIFLPALLEFFGRFPRKKEPPPIEQEKKEPVEFLQYDMHREKIS